MSLNSDDRMVRRDFVRAVIRRAASRRGVSMVSLGEALGYTPARWQQLMTDGDLACPVIADLMLLADLLGDVLLDDLRVRKPSEDGVGDVARQLLGEPLERRKGPAMVRPGDERRRAAK